MLWVSNTEKTLKAPGSTIGVAAASTGGVISAALLAACGGVGGMAARRATRCQIYQWLVGIPSGKSNTASKPTGNYYGDPPRA